MLDESDLFGTSYDKAIGSVTKPKLGAGVSVKLYEDPSFKKKLSPFDPNKVKEEEYSGLEETIIYYQFVYTENELMQLKEKVFGGGLGFCNIGLQAKLTLLSEHRVNNKELSIFLLLAHRSMHCKKLTTQSGKRFRSEKGTTGEIFNAQSKEKLSADQEGNKTRITKDFFQHYGTHYVSRVQLGAIALVKITICGNSSKAIRTLRTEFGAKAGTGIAAANINFATTKMKEKTINNRKAIFQCNLSGGLVLPLAFYSQLDKIEENMEKLILDFNEQVKQSREATSKSRQFNYIIHAKYQKWQKLGLIYDHAPQDISKLTTIFKKLTNNVESTTQLKYAAKCLRLIKETEATSKETEATGRKATGRRTRVTGRKATGRRTRVTGRKATSLVDSLLEPSNIRNSDVVMRLAYFYKNEVMKDETSEKSAKEIEEIFGKEIADIIINYKNKSFNILTTYNEDGKKNNYVVEVDNKDVWGKTVNRGRKLRPIQYTSDDQLNDPRRSFKINFTDVGRNVEFTNVLSGINARRHVFVTLPGKEDNDHVESEVDIKLDAAFDDGSENKNNKQKENNTKVSAVQIRAWHPTVDNDYTKKLCKEFSLHPYRNQTDVQPSTRFCIFYDGIQRCYADYKEDKKLKVLILPESTSSNNEGNIPDQVAFSIKSAGR